MSDTTMVKKTDSALLFEITACHTTYTVRVTPDCEIQVFQCGIEDQEILDSDYTYAELFEDLDEFDYAQISTMSQEHLEQWFWESVNHNLDDAFIRDLDTERDPLNFVGGNEADFLEGLALVALVWNEPDLEISVSTANESHYASIDNEFVDNPDLPEDMRDAINKVLMCVTPHGTSVEYNDGARHQESGWSDGPIVVTYKVAKTIADLPARIKMEPRSALLKWYSDHPYKGFTPPAMPPAEGTRA